MEKQENRFKWARQNIKKESVKTVSNNTGITRSLIDELETNAGKERGVSFLKIKVLAQYYGVSVDWLLGLLPFENWSLKADARIAEEYTGLGSKAVEILHFLGQGKTPEGREVDSFFQYTSRDAVDYFLSHGEGIIVIEELYRFMTTNFDYACRLMHLGHKPGDEEVFRPDDICFLSGKNMEGPYFYHGYTANDFQQMALLKIMDFIKVWKNEEHTDKKTTEE